VSDTIIRRAERQRRIGLSGSTLDRMERRGEFPRRVQLGPRSVGWRESEVDAWIQNRIRGGAGLRLVTAE
jgi:prophage regulatory protein